MKLQELQKRTGLKLAAIIIIGGVLMFTFTGCGNKAEEVTETVAVETVVEMEEDGAIAGGLYSEETDLTGTEAEAVEEYVIDFCDAGNEDITAEQGDIVKMPEYERQKMMSLLPTIFEEFTLDNEKFEILEETENEDGTTTYLVKIVADDIVQNVTAQYSVDEESGLAKALFVYQSAVESPAENLGLNFEVTVAEGGTATVDKILDLYGNDVTDITYFNGDCIGWSLTKWAVGEPDFEIGDELAISQDLAVYPCMDMTNAASEGEDLTVGTWVLSYNGTAIQIGTEFNGKTFSDVYRVEDGKLVDTTSKTVVNEETGEVTENKDTTTTKGNDSATKGGNGTGTEGMTNSTTGTAGGNTSQSGGGSANSGSSGEQPGMSASDFANFWGVTNGGSGLDTSGMDHGAGGAGIVMQ